MNSTSASWEFLSPAERSQVLLLCNVGLPVIERMRRLPAGCHLPEPERSQWWPSEQLRALGGPASPRLTPLARRARDRTSSP